MNALTPASASSPASSVRWPQWLCAALAGLTLAGFGLRLLNLSESLWLDELHTGWVVKDAWSDVAWRAQIGNQSPTWFYAVKLVTSLLGESEATLRLLSLLAGTALIPTAFLLVRSLTTVGQDGSKPAASIAGLFAAALVAVDHNSIFYATEARPYACLQLCAAWQLGLFRRNLCNPTTASRLGWIVLTGLLFHLHYTGMLVVMGELVALVVYYLTSKSRVPYRPWRALFDGQVAVMLCLPALPHLWEVAQRREMWSTMSRRPDAWDLWYLFPLTTLLMATAVAVFSLLLRRSQSFALRPLALVAIWCIAPILAVWLAARFDVARLFLPRYLIAFAIGPMLLTGLCLASLPRRSWQVVLALLLFGYAVYDSQIIEQIRYDGRSVGDRDEDWRGAIAELNKQWSAQLRLVIVDAGLIEETHWSDQLVDDHVALLREQYLTFPLRSLYRGVIPSNRIATAQAGTWTFPLSDEEAETEFDMIGGYKCNASNIVVIRRGQGFLGMVDKGHVSAIPFSNFFFLSDEDKVKTTSHFGDVHILELTLQEQQAE